MSQSEELQNCGTCAKTYPECKNPRACHINICRDRWTSKRDGPKQCQRCSSTEFDFEDGTIYCRMCGLEYNHLHELRFEQQGKLYHISCTLCSTTTVQTEEEFKEFRKKRKIKPLSYQQKKVEI